ncbi:chromate resistance protein ChrB domain-containing protein [Chitinibacter tainanensis]|uniref:chromate resistance protein ChrB domain-containing protein n=1 Tax=Chitinibacter tainanensis TaxID=230667 RepID=UPI002355A293|nr:chromate resistance protein ChrB domain-containing protein [Chitinibacter tainanensis]
MKLISLILTLPTETATVRMRAWRTLKSSGAAVVRDGVYLLPALEACRQTLASIATDVQAAGGSAYVLDIEQPEADEFSHLFDRTADYVALLAEITKVRASLSAETVREVIKQVRKQRKAFAALCEIDFFPNEAQKQADAALKELELASARALAPDEPYPTEGDVARLFLSEYQGRTWATRRRPWVDRLASAWLIRRFIDPKAKLLWLESPADCPTDALGFDFDGARFSHVGHRVTFEVLLDSFGLEAAGLKRLGALVHYLDVGGIQPPESVGIETVLAGLRDAITNDDQLLLSASAVFDGLLSSFEQRNSSS